MSGRNTGETPGELSLLCSTPEALHGPVWAARPPTCGGMDRLTPASPGPCGLWAPSPSSAGWELLLSPASDEILRREAVIAVTGVEDRAWLRDMLVPAFPGSLPAAQSRCLGLPAPTCHRGVGVGEWPGSWRSPGFSSLVLSLLEVFRAVPPLPSGMLLLAGCGVSFSSGWPVHRLLSLPSHPPRSRHTGARTCHVK